MTSILLLMKGFSICSSGIFSTVVVAVCINLWFWSASSGLLCGDLSIPMWPLQDHAVLRKIQYWWLFWSKPVIFCGYICHHIRVCLRTLAWTETCIYFQVKRFCCCCTMWIWHLLRADFSSLGTTCTLTFSPLSFFPNLYLYISLSIYTYIFNPYYCCQQGMCWYGLFFW